MGFSEIRCTLCGVSLHLSRIRTQHEPRSHAWNYWSFDKPGTGFVTMHDYCNLECTPADWEYAGQEGCKVVFREDAALQSRGLRRVRDGRTWEEVVLEGLEEERVDLGEDQGDDEWVPGDEDEMEIDEGALEYEFGSASESREEEDDDDDTLIKDMEDAEMEEAQNHEDESENGTDEQSEYRAWSKKVVASTCLNIYGYSPDRNYEHFEQMRRLGEEFKAKVLTDVKLPLYVPVELLEEPFRSEIEQAVGGFSETRDGTEIVSPAFCHPLNVLGPPEECWEHLAGPNCGNEKGYHGHRISIEEMMSCNVAQGLSARDMKTTWENESTDEDWEGKGTPGWYLTGLVDYMPGRGGGHGAATYPDRHHHGLTSDMDNMWWDVGTRDETAIPFHPTCLEVFKRASLKRYGRFDIHALGNWWRECADWRYMHEFPRAKDVKAGEDEWWQHYVGSEYLATNPCFLPSLRQLLESSRKAQTVDGGPLHTKHRSSLFLNCPVEMKRLIMSYLNPTDVVSVSTAYPNLRDMAQGVLQTTIPRDMPHIWELWCKLPYSRWTGTSAAEIRAALDAFNEQEIEIERVLEILADEKEHKAHAIYKQYWDESREERREKSRAPTQEKPADVFDVQELDLIGLVLRLNKARSDGEPKGLMNRERIWIDCNVILDRIEELQEEGRIPPS